MLKKPSTLFVIGLIALIALLNGFAVELSLYWSLWWFDIMMHILGGLWVGFLALWAYYISGLVHPTFLSRRKIFIFSVLAALVVGGLWELLESFLGLYATEEQILIDTVTDLTMDVVGSFIAATLFTKLGYDKESAI